MVIRSTHHTQPTALVKGPTYCTAVPSSVIGPTHYSHGIALVIRSTHIQPNALVREPTHCTEASALIIGPTHYTNRTAFVIRPTDYS